MHLQLLRLIIFHFLLFTVCLLFGLYNALGILVFNVSCLVSGILQMLVGFIVMALEAPRCFFCIDHVNRVVEKVEERPMWYRAAFYCV